MCQFKSAIVVLAEGEKHGFKLLLSPWTESHEDLVLIHKLRDTKLNFARVEFSPPSMSTAHQVETYKLRLDEARKPDWWTNEIEENVVARLSTYIKSIIVTGEVSILIGGQFIIAPGAKVSNVKQALVMCVLGNATVSGV